MTKTCFTSDHHIGHAGILSERINVPRPFATIAEHDESGNRRAPENSRQCPLRLIGASAALAPVPEAAVATNVLQFMCR